MRKLYNVGTRCFIKRTASRLRSGNKQITLFLWSNILIVGGWVTYGCSVGGGGVTLGAATGETSWTMGATLWDGGMSPLMIQKICHVNQHILMNIHFMNTNQLEQERVNDSSVMKVMDEWNIPVRCIAIVTRSAWTARRGVGLSAVDAGRSGGRRGRRTGQQKTGSGNRNRLLWIRWWSR